MGQQANMNRTKEVFEILTQLDGVSGIWYDFMSDSIGAYEHNTRALSLVTDFGIDNGYSLKILIGVQDGYDDKAHNLFQLWR